MPSRRVPIGSLPRASHSKSTPNLPTLRTLDSNVSKGSCAIEEDAPTPPPPPSPIPGNDGAFSSSTVTSPSEPASIEDFSLDHTVNEQGVAPLQSEDDDDDDDDDDEEDTLPDRLPSSLDATYRPQYSRSSTYLGPSAFAPPFYNRPPTPLPPSPSLTSLLRPNFTSAAPSRPGTPDPSSDEGGTTTTTNAPPTGAQTPNSAAATTLSSSFRTAKPIPRASPKVPTYEYYGFTLYLTSSLAFLIYLLWSFLPSPFLHQLGIYYYPNRWWSLAIPAWLVMLVVYIFVALASFNTGTLTLNMANVECMVDDAACIAVVDEHGTIVRGERTWNSQGKEKPKRDQPTNRSKKADKKADKWGTRYQDRLPETKDLDWRSLWNEGTDAVLDVPIGGVCEVLYGRPDEDDEDAFIYES